MNLSRGLLYPAFHKFYSALDSLKKFGKGNDFFDNISYLDNFFSEYRNITFVLQKSLNNTKFKSSYEKLRDQYLINDVGRWFVDKRNEVIKQNPFNLEKKIAITIYLDDNSITLPEIIFTIENDKAISTIIDSVRKTFINLKQAEILFSVEFTFYEIGQRKDLYDSLITGINQMKNLLSDIKSTINEECLLCNELEKKIDEINFYRVPKDFLFIDDYVYYFERDSFDKSSRITMWPGQSNLRIPIENLTNNFPKGDLFCNFEIIHLEIFQMQKSILPTCYIFYNDNTFELISFGFTIKTTLYRKFAEITNRIKTDKIVKIFFVSEMYTYEILNSNNIQHDSSNKENEVLAFFMVDNQLNIKSHKFEISKIDDLTYIGSLMFSTKNNQLLPAFIQPIFNEFTRLKKK
jgi:hypothetical protein